jgi:hypothetical protein
MGGSQIVFPDLITLILSLNLHSSTEAGQAHHQAA